MSHSINVYQGSTTTTVPRGGRRPGAGRPQILDDPQRVTIVLEATTVDELALLAEAEDQTFTGYVRRVLQRHVPGT